MQQLIPVTARKELFSFENVKKQLPVGLSISEMVDQMDLPLAFSSLGIVRINNHEIRREYWHAVKPKNPANDRHIIITMHMVPHGGGGGGGGKNVLATVAMVAVAATALFVSGGGLGPGVLGWFGASFAAGGTGAALAGAGISAVGMLAVSALSPPPIVPNLAPSNAAPEIKTIAGIRANQATPFEILPRVLGKMRVSPPMLSVPYRTLENGIVTVNTVVGLTGRHKIEDIWINKTAITEFDEVEVQTREGAPGDAPITIAEKFVIEKSNREKLSEWQLDRTNTTWTQNQTNPEKSAPNWQFFKTAGRADQIWMMFVWPTGMSQGANRVGVPIAVEMRLKGETTWVKLPEFHFSDTDATQAEIRQHIRLLWKRPPVQSRVAHDDNFGFIAYGHIGSATFLHNADDYFNKGGSLIQANHVEGTIDGFDVYLDPTVFPVGEYEVRVKRGLAYAYSSFDKTAYTYDGARANARWYDHYTTSEPHQVRVAQRDILATTIIEAFSTYRDDKPFIQDDLAVIAISAKHVQIDTISAVCTSYAKTVASGFTVEAPTSNPADLFRHVMIDYNSDPLEEDQINDAKLIEWYNHCTTKAYECNTIATGDSVEQYMQLIASTGFAVQQRSEKWGVVIEKDRTSEPATQMFTPINTRGLTKVMSFADIPHAIRAQYRNGASEYAPSDEVITYRSGYDVTNATKIESINYDGFTDTEKVKERVRFDMRNLELRQARYQFEAGIENFVSNRGDLVGLTNDFLNKTHFYGRVVRVIKSGDNVTGLELNFNPEYTEHERNVFMDENYFGPANYFEKSNRTGLSIRCVDQTVITHELTVPTTPSQIVTFKTPFADPGTIEYDCLVTIGEIGHDFIRGIVFTIDMGEEKSARITLVDEAPGIWL